MLGLHIIGSIKYRSSYFAHDLTDQISFKIAVLHVVMISERSRPGVHNSNLKASQIFFTYPRAKANRL